MIFRPELPSRHQRLSGSARLSVCMPYAPSLETSFSVLGWHKHRERGIPVVALTQKHKKLERVRVPRTICTRLAADALSFPSHLLVPSSLVWPAHLHAPHRGGIPPVYKREVFFSIHKRRPFSL